jgi:ubiquinone/menaquinone biosynthesis C-methylase UbiE
MNYEGVDTARITAEYERRAREIPGDFYSLGRPGNLLLHQQTVRSCIQALHRANLYPLHGRRVLDVGCGVGTWLLEFAQWGADPEKLAGIDLMPARLQTARERMPQADLRGGSASDLPWEDESFDLVSQMIVFSTFADPALKRTAAREMLRVLKPGGAILWVDMRVDNPANREVRGLRKAEIRELFPDCSLRLAPALLAPPISRWIAGRAWALGELLHTLPFLRTHYTGLIVKRG